VRHSYPDGAIILFSIIINKMRTGGGAANILDGPMPPHYSRDLEHGPGAGSGLLPQLPPPTCSRPVSGVGLGLFVMASLVRSPGPCSPTVFRSAICDCLSITGCFSQRSVAVRRKRIVEHSLLSIGVRACTFATFSRDRLVPESTITSNSRSTDELPFRLSRDYAIHTCQSSRPPLHPWHCPSPPTSTVPITPSCSVLLARHVPVQGPTT
jgi:hypothetical protein